MSNKESYRNKKSIIIYFSRADENYGVGFINKGNTEIVAEYIRGIIGADMFKVEPKLPYAKDYDTCIEEAKERQISHNAMIEEDIPDLSSYEVIYIGSPVYWGIMPEELVTALKTKDFTGKIIRPFVTHEGSGLSGIPSQIKNICKKAEVLEGLSIYGSSAQSSKDIVNSWL